MNQVMVNPSDLLKIKVPDYVPSSHVGIGLFNRRRPILTNYMIREMIRAPRVKFGLKLIKGPLLSKAKLTVESKNEETRQFVVDTYNQFWKNGAVQALKALEWGFSGHEVLYKLQEKTQRIVYNGLKPFESPSVRVVTKDGQKVGILVYQYNTVNMSPNRPVYLGGPKSFLHVYDRHEHPYYGHPS